MDAAGGDEDGLGFVRGLLRQTINDLLARSDCAVSIISPNRTFVVGGARSKVEGCSATALERGATAARLIDVYVASHTERLSAVVEPFLKAMRAIPLARNSPERQLIGVSDPQIIRWSSDLERLPQQVGWKINWAATLKAYDGTWCQSRVRTRSRIGAL